MTESTGSIAEGIAALADERPEVVAVTCGASSITWAQLEARTNRLARAYEVLGVAPDRLVTIGLPNGLEFIEATIATWKAGATPQPVSHRLPAPERRAIIDLADPALVVGADAGGRPVVPVGYEPDAAIDASPLPPRFARSVKAPTSGGTTGRPKLIVSGQPATVADVTIHSAYSGMRRGGVHLATGPLHHNGPFIFAFAALLTGNHVVVMPRFDPDEALALIALHQVDWMYAVPTMLQRIWRLPAERRLAHDLSSLRTVLHTAAPCPEWVKVAWIGWLGPERILELYGGTEGQLATLIDGVQWLEHGGSVGRALVGELQVRDADGRVLASGETGTVWLRGPEEAPRYAYVGATATADGQGWETLGDIGHLDDDGFLYLTGREGDMIVVGGSNVYPAEVEAALAEHPSVVEACVMGLPHEDLGSVPHALVRVAGDVDDDELFEHLRSRLVAYKIPRSFERVDGALRDEAGKLRRSAIRSGALR